MVFGHLRQGKVGEREGGRAARGGGYLLVEKALKFEISGVRG